MGVFTGNEILFFITGLLVAVSGGLIFKLNQTRHFQWHGWITSILGSGMLIFAINWAVSGILEGEPQAANVGLMVFGIPAIILIGVTIKLNMARKQGN